MKKARKFLSLLLAMAMVMAMSMTAFAADTYSIKITADENSGNTTGHEYTVYQLFTGELSTKVVDGETKEVLANVVYGTAGLGTVGNSVPADDLKDIESAANARAYANSLDLTKLAAYGEKLTESNNWTMGNVPTGYYLIVDDTTKNIADEDSFSRYIVQVVGDVNMAPKSEKVTSDKTTLNDDVEEVTSNEAGVGAVVSYKLTANIPNNADDYDYYAFILSDTLSTGLTFNNDVKVYFVVDDNENLATEENDYVLYTGTDSTQTNYADGHTFQVALRNAKAHAGATVLVTYSATVNSKAVAMQAETNTFKVTYSNDPEHKYEPNYNPPEDEDENPHPGKPIDKLKDTYGETPEKITKTYDTELVLTKVDESGTLLKGATFKLVSEDANQTVLATETYYELDPNGTYYLLKNGKYTQTAPSRTEYVKVGTGDSHTTEGYIEKITKVEGQDDVVEYIVPEDTKDYIDKDLYMLVLGNDSEYASTNTYKKVTDTDVEETDSYDAPVEIIATTDAEGKITFSGLGTGTYKLVEVDAPDGYNYAADTEFKIEFVAADPADPTSVDTFIVKDKEGNTVDSEFPVKEDSGKFDVTIVDQSGTVLPETGGMGTTIFYIIGGILVLGAGVLLVTKRRMNAR